MTQTAELKIKPSIVGSVSSKLGALKRDLGTMSRDQVRGLRDGERWAGRVERAYDGIGRSARTAANLSRGLVNNIFNMRNAVMGIVAGTAGKTIFDLTIGSQDKLNRHHRLMGALLNDHEKMIDMQRSVGALTNEIMGFSRLDATEGMAKTLHLADGSIDRAREMVRVGKALEALDPSRGFSGALEAIRNLEFGQVRSLRQFGIDMPSQNEAAELARQDGKNLKDWYFDKLQQELDRNFAADGQTGVERLLQIDDLTIAGQMAHVKTRFKDMMMSIGQDAYPIINDAMPRLQDAISSLQADPQFREDMLDLTRWLAGAAEASVKMAQRLPGAIRDARAFIQEHSTLLKLAGGAFVANRMTGGALGRGAAAGLGGAFSMGRTALFGRQGGSGATGGLAGAAAAANATPVYVVNMGEGGGMGGAGGGAGSAAGSAARRGGLIGSAQAVGGMGMGGLGLAAGAGAAIFGSFAAGAWTLKRATEGTARAVDLVEQRLQREAAASQRKPGTTETPAETLHEVNRRKARQAVESASTMVGMGQMGRARGMIESMFGGGDAVFEGTDSQQELLDMLNQALVRAGVEVNFKKGQSVSQGMSVSGGRDVLLRDEMVAKQSQQLDALASKVYNPDGSVRDEGLMAELKESGQLDKLVEMSDSLKVLVQQANARADGLRTAQAQAPVNFDKFEVNFHGPVNDSADVRKATAEMRDDVRRAIQDILREDRQRSE